jgi:hypothetical protein
MSTPPDPEVWQDCPPGQLAEMVGRIRFKERRRFLRQAAQGASALLVLGVGGAAAAQWIRADRPPRYGGLACSEVMQLMPDYRSHRLGEALAAKVAIHLEKCPHCRSQTS